MQPRRQRDLNLYLRRRSDDRSPYYAVQSFIFQDNLPAACVQLRLVQKTTMLALFAAHFEDVREVGAEFQTKAHLHRRQREVPNSK